MNVLNVPWLLHLIGKDLVQEGGPEVSEEPKKGSGTHPAVLAYRKKMDSVRDGTLPLVDALNARLDRALEKMRTLPPPGTDPRREPEEDERREEEEPPVDVVIPFPLPKNPAKEK